MRQSILAAAIALMSGAMISSTGASAEYFLPDGNDNPMPSYYDYRPEPIFYGTNAPVAYSYSYVAGAPVANPAAVPAAPSYGYVATQSGYGYTAPAYAPPLAGAVVARPTCGEYRFWRNGRCVDKRGN
jgi:hypothetical protein